MVANVPTAGTFPPLRYSWATSCARRPPKCPCPWEGGASHPGSSWGGELLLSFDSFASPGLQKANKKEEVLVYQQQ